MFLYLIVIIVLLYALQVVLLLYGMTRLKYSRTEVQPRVSVIVAARNEEKTIAACLVSLSKLDYPKEKLEIIIVDDRSNDATGSIIKRFTRSRDHFQVITITENSNPLSGKANAISRGIERSSGEIILLTDADCILPSQWISEYVSYFTPEVGLVAGVTLLDRRGDDTPSFGKIQSLDWAYLLGIGAGSVGLGLPLSCIGNNFAFRKKAYLDAGGYQHVGFSVTEDFALFKIISQKTPWRIRFLLSPETLVLSKPMTTLKEFYHQRQRWATGGKHVRFFGKLLIAIGCLTHLLIPLGFIFVDQWVMVSLALLVILLFDFFLLLKMTYLFHRTDLLKYFPLYEIFYFIYTTFYAVVMPFNGKIEWKEIVYNTRKQKAS